MDEIWQYYGIIFSLTVIFLNPIQWTALWYVHQKRWNIWACHSFWRSLCFSRVARGDPFVGTWLHGNLYIVHYKGFECAEIWHSWVQSEAANLHLLLYPEMLEMPSLCVSKKICTETHIWPVVFNSQVASTRKIIMGAQESLGTVILRVITDYRIFLVFFMVWTVATEKRSQASCCGNTVPSMSTHVFIQSSLTTKQQVHFFTAQLFVPTLFFFHFLWRRLIPLFIV